MNEFQCANCGMLVRADGDEWCPVCRKNKHFTWQEIVPAKSEPIGCPFCGDPPTVENSNYVRFIGCNGTNCAIQPNIGSVDFYDFSFDEMVNLWNNRPNK